MKKRLLIIGSVGFIGNNAAKYFSNKGYEIYCADIIIKNNENYTIINAESPDYSLLFSKTKYDICINASGAASVPLSFKYPNIDFTLNVSNVFKILEAIRDYNPKCKMINISSAAVYGNPLSLPINENAMISPVSPYGYHKYYSERICSEFYELYNIHTLSLRVFSAYGEGLKKQLFWDIFCKIKNSVDNKIELLGTGCETRDFIYIFDLLRAIEIVIKKQEFTGQAINVSSGIESSIKEAAIIFVNYIKPDIQLIFNNENKLGDPKNWRADISSLNELGYKPKYNIDEGLRNYSLWLKKV